MTIKDFTPVFDSIIKKHDAYTALVYGRIWRFSQGDLKKSTASQKTLAKNLGISVATVARRISLLLDDGYILQVGGGKKAGATAEYVPTGKAYLRETIAAIDEIADGPSESDRGSITEQEGVHQRDGGGTSESKTKKQDNKQSKETSNNNAPNGAKPKIAKDEIRKVAETRFKDITRLPVPKSKGEAGSQWWRPLREICELAEWDTNTVEFLIESAIKRMRNQKLDIYSPASILKASRAVVAQARGGIISENGETARDRFERRMESIGGE